MRLYNLVVTMFRRGADLDVIMPGFSAKLAENKLRQVLREGRLFIGRSYEQLNKNTGQPETVHVREKVTGMPSSINAHEIHHTAFHRRRWDEEKQVWRFRCPRNRGRNVAEQQYSTSADFAAGWLAATKDYNPRCKSAEAKLKAALKKHKGDKIAFKRAYLRKWERLGKELLTRKSA